MTVTVDLTGLAVAVTGGLFSTILAVALAWVNGHVKDAAARSVLDNAVKNSVGAIQQAATSVIQRAAPAIPGVPTSLAPGVQYVLDQVPDALTRLGVTPQALAAKVEAQIGLKNIETNIATTSSTQPEAVVPPLTTVPAAVSPA